MRAVKSIEKSNGNERAKEVKTTCLEFGEHVVDEVISLALGRMVLTRGRVHIVCRAAGINISLLLLLCDLSLALLGQTRHVVGLCIG